MRLIGLSIPCTSAAIPDPQSWHEVTGVGLLIVRDKTLSRVAGRDAEAEVRGRLTSRRIDKDGFILGITYFR